MSNKSGIRLPGLKIFYSLLFLTAVLFGLMVLPAQNALACDEGDQSGFMMQAPVTATSCTTTPQTITVLAQTIDVTSAKFGDWREDEAALTCASLTTGQVVRVTFANDTLTNGNLTAVAVRFAQGHDDNQPEVKISGLLQTAPTTTTPPFTVQVLGVTVTVTSTTTLESDDDEAATASQLAVGQFASINIDPASITTPPLTATNLFFRLLETQVQAPLDAAPSCNTTPQTISVLGQTIDISSVPALLSKEGEGGGTFLCTDLTAGQVVKVTLVDATLKASEVEIGEGQWGDQASRARKQCWRGDDRPEVKVAAPIVGITTTTTTPPTTTVTVLGTGVITVDITNADLEAEEGQPIALSDLIPGEYIKMILSSNTPAGTPPVFTATELQAITPTNVVGFEVYDEHGHHVDDGGVQDVSAAVAVTKRNKVVTLHTTSSGDFRMANMPSGQTKVAVTRANSGKKSKAANVVKVNPKTTKNVKIFLKPVRR